MRKYSKLVLVVVLLLFIYLLIYYNAKNNEKFYRKSPELTINIAVVVCGHDRIDESLVMMKSALIFRTGNATLNFIIVTEENLREIFEEKIENLKNFRKFSHEIFNLKFPSNDDKETWLKLFKPCASQRLFLPTLLPQHDSLIYVDCDVIFLASPHLLYSHFRSFDDVQISAMASESENFNTGWYTRFARHPFYQPFGVNSGVMLMNLTRMRNRNFEDEIQPIYRKYRNKLAWGDQDILNIYFEQHPHEMHLMKCEYNYRPDHCMYTSQCDISGGVKVLHGNRGYFHKEGKQRIFREIYKAIDEFQSTDNPCSHIVKAIEGQVEISDTSNCNELINEFLFIPKKLFCQIENENEIFIHEAE